MAANVKPLRVAMHRTVLAVHRWTGLTVGLVLAFMAATGIFLSYRSRMEPLVYRDLLTAPACANRIPLDTLAANAHAAHPKGTLDYARIKAAQDGRVPATQVRVSGRGFQDDVFLDPCTGKVLGQRGRYGGFFGAMESLHKFHFVKNGWIITGSSALIFVLVLAIAGIWLWWPRRLSALKSAIKPRLPGRTIDRHKLLGVYASAVLCLMALTGLPQAFDWVANAIYKKPPAPESIVSGTPRKSLETYWQHVQSLVPNPAETLIHFPSKPREPAEIFIIGPDAPHANARTMLFLDACSDEVLSFTPYAQNSLGMKLYFWTLSMHTGQIGGIYGPLVLITGALSMLVLAWTGIGSFLRRRLKKMNAISESVQHRFTKAA